MEKSFSTFKKYGIYAFLAMFVLSCKSNKIVTDGSIDANLGARTIIKNHYQNQLDFKTLSGKMKIDYSDGESSQGVSVSLRMEKDRAIWISAPLGVVKAYITPDRVSFYNKLDNEYFDGDFGYLSNLLGTELNFEKLQNVLLGEAIVDLKEGKYDATVANNAYRLMPKKTEAIFKAIFEIEPKNFKMAGQLLSQPEKNRMLQIDYKNYQLIDGRVVPNEINITAMDTDKTNTIALEYRNVEFNRPVSFPYKIPSGFKEIVLK
ncbi:MAG: DUF4292 domain-containing protein [Sediminicola sp.]